MHFCHRNTHTVCTDRLLIYANFRGKFCLTTGSSMSRQLVKHWVQCSDLKVNVRVSDSNGQLFNVVIYMRRKVRKRTFGHMRPAKIQIRLRIRAVWSESSLGAFWISKNAKFLHVDNKDWSPMRMRRLIWVFFVLMWVGTFFHVWAHVFAYVCAINGKLCTHYSIGLVRCTTFRHFFFFFFFFFFYIFVVELLYMVSFVICFRWREVKPNPCKMIFSQNFCEILNYYYSNANKVEPYTETLKCLILRQLNPLSVQTIMSVTNLKDVSLTIIYFTHLINI